MPELTARLATESDPRTVPDAAWSLTQEAREAFVEQAAAGLPVTVGYDRARTIGHVVYAELTDDGVEVEMDLYELLPPGSRVDLVGPSFTLHQAVLGPSGERRDIGRVRFLEVAVLPEEPG